MGDLVARTISVEIIGDAKGLNKAFSEASSQSSKFGKAIGMTAKIAGGVAVGGFAALAAATKVGVGEFLDAQKVQAQTSATLKSTGAAANVTKGHIEDLAGALLNKSGVDDEAIQSSENLLLTFTNIRNEAGKGNKVFDQTTAAVLDMDEAMTRGNSTAESLKNTSILVGKALNDPVKGATALRRVGVALTEQQQDQIKAFVKSGDTMKAQKVILGELSKEFGGSATAAGKTLSGQMNVLKETFNNVAGAAVEKMVPAFSRLLSGFMDILPTVEAFVSNLEDKLSPTVQSFSQTASKVWPVIQQAASVLVGFFTSTVVPIWDQLSREALSAVNAVAQVVQSRMPQIRQIIDNVGTVIKNLAEIVLPILGFAFGKVLPAALNIVIPILARVSSLLADASKVVRTVALAIEQNIDRVPDAFQRVLSWLRGNWPMVATIISGPFAPIVALATNAFGIRSALLNALGRIVGDVQSKFQAVGGFISGWAGSAYAYAFKIGSAIVSGIVGGLGGLFGAAKNAMVGAMEGAFSAVKGVFGIHSPSQRAADELGKPFADGVVMGWVTGAAALPSKMSDSLKQAIDAARQIVDNSRSRFADAFGDLASTAGSAFDAIASAAQTKSEKALAALTAAHDAAAAAASLADARSQLATAKTDLASFAPTDDMTPEAAAQKRADLGAAVKNAQQAVDDLLYQQKVAALQKRAEAERLDLDATQALRKKHFDTALETLQKSLAKEGSTAGEATKDVLKLLGNFGVDFKDVGQDMGAAWVRGLKEAIAAAASQSGALSGAVSKAADGIKVPKRAAGGPVLSGQTYLVGERGPELFTASQSGRIIPNGGAATAGGGDLHATFVMQAPNGDVLWQETKRYALRDLARNGTLGLAAG